MKSDADPTHNHGPFDQRNRSVSKSARDAPAGARANGGPETDRAHASAGSGDRAPHRGTLIALGQLAGAAWITPAQYEAGAIFADLCRRDDALAVRVRNEIMADLVKIDALDLARRVCCENNLRIALDRMPALRDALDIAALRIRQIEISASPRRAARVLRPSGR